MKTSPRQEDYQTAYLLACEELKKKDIEQQCKRAGASYQSTEQDKAIITIKFLNRNYLISLPEVEVRYKNSEQDVQIWEKILILHYLNSARDISPAGKSISFKEVPSGSFYYPAFIRRAKEPLVKAFGENPGLLIDAASKLGGQEGNYGDTAVTIRAFPHVPVTFVLWRGDEEFPPEGNILFDSTISDYLSTEDISVLCGMIVSKLIKRREEK